MERYSGNTRTRGAKKLWEPWDCQAPLCEKPYYSPHEVNKYLNQYKITKPRLYGMGFSHNNCGGFCVKAGHDHFKLLLEKFPERFAFHEDQEQRMRDTLNKDVSILRDRRGGKSTPLPLAELRNRNCPTEGYDFGGCGCFSDEIEQEEGD